MKRFMLLLLVVLLMLPIASSQVMRKLIITVELLEDSSASININYRFTDEIKVIDFPFSGPIENLEVTNGECKVLKEIQQILQCKPLSPFIVGESEIGVKFNTSGLAKKQGNITYFSFDIPVAYNTGLTTVTVKLPTGMGISDKVSLPVSPSGADIGSDGRVILARWVLDSKKPGDIIPVRIYYESTGSLSPIRRFDYRMLVILAVIPIAGVVLIYQKVSSRKAHFVLSVLDENERTVVDIMQSQEEEKVDQRKIVAASGFSKAKVSRVLKSLEGRGIVEIERLGRKNKIKLKRKFVKEE